MKPGVHDLDTVGEMIAAFDLVALQEVNENRTRAAELLGISIRTLRNKLREYKNEDTGNTAIIRSRQEA